MLDQMPMERFEASGQLTISPPIPLANANGNRGIYFEQRVVPYRVECGTAESTFDVVEKKWTGLPLLCACRQSCEVKVAVPLCMWEKIDRRRVRDAFRSALVTSASREATNSCLRGQPLIRDIVSRISICRCVSEYTDGKRLQIEEQRKSVLDEIESSTDVVFDTQLWRDAGLIPASLVFKVEEPVPFKWTYKVTADDVELDTEELRQKIVDHLDLH
jgi:hypothetical protein